jgi:hypothetical protein
VICLLESILYAATKPSEEVTQRRILPHNMHYVSVFASLASASDSSSSSSLQDSNDASSSKKNKKKQKQKKQETANKNEEVTIGPLPLTYIFGLDSTDPYFDQPVFK